MTGRAADLAGAVSVPHPIARAAGCDRVIPVWRNGLGGVTFQLGAGLGRRFAKWAPAGSGLNLQGEAERCRWAADYALVPRVIDIGNDAAGTWLITEGLPGENAITPRWKAQPERAVISAARGLRQLHDLLPVAQCPFDWSVPSRLAQAEADGLVVATLPPAPPVDHDVVCHGDACIPNTLLDDEGRYCGHVDLGSLGVADRWADLAVATVSLDWNYGPGWQETFLQAYGVEPDLERISYYRGLWNLWDDVGDSVDLHPSAITQPD